MFTHALFDPRIVTPADLEQALTNHGLVVGETDMEVAIEHDALLYVPSHETPGVFKYAIGFRFEGERTYCVTYINMWLNEDGIMVAEYDALPDVEDLNIAGLRKVFKKLRGF